jgi:hypothetical protein
MKDIWSDFFYDIKECGLTEDQAAKAMGGLIFDDLDRIEEAIKKYDGIKALELIKQMKIDY